MAKLFLLFCLSSSQWFSWLVSSTFLRGAFSSGCC